MANPVATILNPQGDRILHFWVDENRRLALSQLDVGNKNNLVYADRGTPSGKEVTNQSIAVVYLRGLPVVFGKIAVGDQKQPSLVLGQLSPITNILANNANDLSATTIPLPAFAAVSDSEDTAWFYYLLKPDAERPTALVEARFNFDKFEHIGLIPSLSDSLQPDEKTRLAVLYADEGHREVFYQKKGYENQIFCLRVGGGNKEPQHIDGTENAMDGTPIAATRTESGAVYVYYVSDKGRIQRATRETIEWKHSASTMTKFSNMIVEKSTQLAVVSTKLGGKQVNNLFYIGSDERGYTRKIDKDDVV